MSFNTVKGCVEVIRPWGEMGVGMGIVLVICLMAGRGGRSSPEYQDRLIAGAQGGNVRQIDEAIKGGTSLEIRDENGLTPLMIAARAGRSEAVGHLIERGANVNAVSERFGTALMLACRNEKVEAVRRLVNAGADVTLGDEAGNAAETWARESGNEAILQMVTHRAVEAHRSPQPSPTRQHSAPEAVSGFQYGSSPP